MHEAGARIVEANGVLHVVVDVSGVNWDGDVVVLLLQGCERSNDLALLVRQQVRLLWRKLDLVLVLVRHLPLVLERDA